jgi:FkbM family methyltransferase
MPPAPNQQAAVVQAIANLQAALSNQAEELLRSRQRTAAVEARLVLADQGRKPRFPIQFRSQYGEDLWIWDVLGWQTEGFFIEVGAFDGFHNSVTYALEAMGWKGLLIEALPEKYELCRAKRPHSHVVNTALGRRNGPPTAKFVSVADADGGMLSYIPSAAAADHAKRISDARFQTKTFETPMTTMDELLKDHTGPIDVAVIDVEGFELDVLDGFNLDKHKPRLLLLEDNTRGQNPALGNWMSTKPYTFAGWLAVNRLYVRADEERMLDRLRRS